MAKVLWVCEKANNCGFKCYHRKEHNRSVFCRRHCDRAKGQCIKVIQTKQGLKAVGK